MAPIKSYESLEEGRELFLLKDCLPFARKGEIVRVVHILPDPGVRVERWDNKERCDFVWDCGRQYLALAPLDG